MWASILNNFKAFNVPFERVVKYMYLDIRGLVTVGMGNLIDGGPKDPNPMRLALELPFRYKNKPGIKNPGQLASQADIVAEWNLIKSKQELAKKGYKHCEPLTKLELNDVDINNLIFRRLFEFESYLKKYEPFKQLDKWPADAQMGLLSMAWAMGPGFSPKWPKFSAACKKMDFDAAAENCRIREAGNPGIIPRNNANQLLFRNAAAVLAGESAGFYDRRILYYPQVLLKPITITGDQETLLEGIFTETFGTPEMLGYSL